VNGDLCVAFREAFASAKVEGNAGPSPVVDIELKRDEGFSAGLGIDSGLGAVAGNSLVADGAWSLLAAHAVLQNVFGVQGLECVQNFCLFVSDGVGLERNRRFHGSQT